MGMARIIMSRRKTQFLTMIFKVGVNLNRSSDPTNITIPQWNRRCCCEEGFLQPRFSSRVSDITHFDRTNEGR